MSSSIEQDVPAIRSVAEKSVAGSAFNIGASAITLVLGFTRSVLLARLLAPEHFGLFTLAMFFVSLVGRANAFGFNAALTHRNPHDEEDVSTHFILRIGGSLFVFLLAAALSPLILLMYPSQPLLPLIIIVLLGLNILSAINSTPIVLLAKGLEFRRIAILDVLSSISALIVSVFMARSGWGVWSLVGGVAAGAVVRFIGLWIIRRPWSPHFRVSWSSVKWYFQFGRFALVTSNLNFLLDRFDDFWIGTYLGGTALGFYTKAYEFARYPRRIVANPVQSVSFSTFAKLQHDRERLSKAYFRTSSLIVRVGFLFAGIFIIVTPEFIRIFPGEKWLPMAFTFQLMMIYTLFDPLLLISGGLTTAVGRPQALSKVKLGQMLFFLPTVVVLGHFYGINGVAVAADLMMVLGFILIISPLKRYVDFSIRQMLGIPSLALTLAFLTTSFFLSFTTISNDVLALIFKGTILMLVYGIVLLIFERDQMSRTMKLVLHLIFSGRNNKLSQPKNIK